MNAVSLTPQLQKGAIEQFAAHFQGRLIGRDDAEFDEARAVWNGMIDRRPVLIARCANRQDVIDALRFAAEHELPVAVRGGKHSVAGHSTIDDGLVIDLGELNEVVVEPHERTVSVGGGATLADLDRATQAHGLVVPMGVVSATGVAGLTLGGGYGWLRERYGLACDNLIGAEVILADGQVLQTSEQQHPDLLWGLRGGGGNLGIVTRFLFRAFPLGPQVRIVFAIHDGERAADMERGLRFYRDYAATSSDRVSTLMALGRVPAEEPFEKSYHGQGLILLAGLYAGPPEKGAEALRPLREFSEPLADFGGVMPYVEAQQLFDPDYPDGLRYYWKSINLSRLDDAAIPLIVEHARRQPSPLSTIDLWAVGGAMRREPTGGSAYYGRDADFLVTAEANWEDAADDEANKRWARDLMAAMEPYSDGSRYLNFAGLQEEGQTMMRRAFGPNYGRLAKLKKKYDPHNLFARNPNVPPA